MKKLFCLFFVILLSAPVTLWLVGHMRGNGDNTVRQGFPHPEADLWLDREYYRAVEGWFQESLPIAKPLKIFNNWLSYHLFAASSTPTVHVGIHGWLYPGQSATDQPDMKTTRQAGNRLLLDLHAVEKIISASGHRFLFTVVPGKAAIYPEYFGVSGRPMHNPLYLALIDAHQRHRLSGFIGLEPALKKAKLSGLDVYNQRSRHWNCDGAAAAAEQILNTQEMARPVSGSRKTITCPAPDNKLYRMLLGETVQIKVPLAGHTSGPHAVTGPSAVIYGDDYLIRLLPFITHAFNAMQVIDSTREPTFDHKLLATAPELIVLESGENGLERLHLDLESLYDNAKNPLQGVVKRDIALDGATAVSQCALDLTPEGLKIRSSGPQAFFSLPVSSGSTADVFRMVKLTFSRTHQGRITIRIRPDVTGLTQKTLSRENRHVIIPLPFYESVAIQINPSEHPGVFNLHNAELLSFYGNHPPPAQAAAKAVAGDGDIYSGMEIKPLKAPTAEPLVESLEQAALHPTDTLPELTLVDIQAGRIVQRQGKVADIVVTGTYTGVSGPVEARVVAAGSDSVVVPWTVVDGSPENGLFTGILHHVPQGGWYHLQVRSAITPWMVKKGSNPWGVGMLVACIGQSNMREWFYTGNDHHPAPMVMIYRDKKWIAPGSTGNGALALGKRLSAALEIPIGLLDYSINGTGLTAKAEWGKGFWLDTGPNGIYRRFIDGVNATGGVLEYVIWMQGEADAARGSVSREEYREALERLVNDGIRLDIQNGSTRSQLPFLIIPLVKRPSGKDIPCQRIRNAQMDALDTIRECHLAALSLDLENRGRQHLAPSSYTTLGVRTAQTILYLLGKVPYHRGPAISTLSRVADRIIDVTIAHRGGTDFTPWTDVTGFEVVSGKQSLPIAAISRKDGSTVRIEFEAPAAGNVNLRYLYGAHPDTSSPIRDNTDLRLPLEPYYR